MNNDKQLTPEGISIETYNKFCSDAMLDSNRSAWKKRRNEGVEFGVITITGTGPTFGKDLFCWWAPYVGLTVFARLEMMNCKYTGKRILKAAFPVRLTPTLIHEGRGITPDSFTIS